MEQQRSIFVTVVAWIFIVFSALALLEFVLFGFIPFSTLFPGQIPAGPNQPNPALVASFMRGVMLVFGLITAWVLLSSIGLLRRKNWARISFIVILILGIVSSALSVLIGALGAFAVRNLPANASTPADVQAIMPGMMTFMAVMGVVFIGLYSWILVKLLSARIREEFKPRPPA
ncbi:MAG TPA: hypothetical protein VFL15_06080 [Gammaproteobacteria bacterium]|nr:hypothetical protein [Gammaproteobacteria bacterium]